MELLQVDMELCVRCGVCTHVCPKVIISQGDDGAPAECANAAAMCIRCNQCVAICPTGALGTIHAVPAEGMTVTHAKVDHDEVMQLFGMRRSVRSYLPEPIAPDEMDRLLEVANMAPSASNIRPVEWVVIEGRENLDRVIELCIGRMRLDERYADYVSAYENDGNDVVLRGCTSLAVAHARNDLVWGGVDCAIAATHLELAASMRGYGACWGGIVMSCAAASEELRDALHLPEGHAARAVLMLGRPALKYARTAPREPAKVAFVRP